MNKTGLIGAGAFGVLIALVMAARGVRLLLLRRRDGSPG
jgi:3-hydroxyacyl-CoA dehydrogenase